MRTVSLTPIALLLCAAAASAAPCPTRPSWPTDEWPSRVEETAVSKAEQIRALEDYAFTLTGADVERNGIRTDGLLIIKSGTIVYERYARGFDETKRHISWSVAKSITSTMTGLAVARGALTVSDSICRHLSGLRDELCPITVKHLLEFGSGLHWQETYEDLGYQGSSVISMLFGAGHRDWAKWVTDRPVDHPPGTFFNYSTGEATLLAEVVRRAVEPELGARWPQTLLFERIGMKSAVLQRDVKGTPAGGSHVFATPRDYARFGYFILNDGCWEQQRLLPEGWVQKATTLSETFKAGHAASDTWTNGFMWWLNQPAADGAEAPFVGAPADMFSAIGHWGQYVVVVPSRDVVIVRTGDDRNEDISLGRLTALALEVAQ